MKSEVSGSKRPTTAPEKTPTDFRPRREGYPNLLKGNIRQGLGRPRKILEKLGTGRAPTLEEIAQVPDRKPVQVRRMLWDWGKDILPRPTKKQLEAGHLPPRLFREYLIKDKGQTLANGKAGGGHVRVRTTEDPLFLECWVSPSRMAKDLGVSMRTVKYRVKNLIQEGILHTRRERKKAETLGRRYLTLCPGMLPQKPGSTGISPTGRKTDFSRPMNNTEALKDDLKHSSTEEKHNGQQAARTHKRGKYPPHPLPVISRDVSPHPSPHAASHHKNGWLKKKKKGMERGGIRLLDECVNRYELFKNRRTLLDAAQAAWEDRYERCLHVVHDGLTILGQPPERIDYWTHPDQIFLPSMVLTLRLPAEYRNKEYLSDRISRLEREMQPFLPTREQALHCLLDRLICTSSDALTVRHRKLFGIGLQKPLW